MNLNPVKLTAVLITLLAVNAPCGAQEPAADFTVEGLQLIEDSGLALVYAEPGVDFSQYRRIYLDDVHVAFNKTWLRSQNRNRTRKITADDMAKMKSELAGLFSEVFTQTLREGGYELVSERAEDVLLIKPAIINLDIVAPDVREAGIVHTYTETAGEMTLYLELYDSLTDDLVAKALDRQKDRSTGYFEWRNRVSNRAAAKRILKVWARVLKEGLDDATGARR